MDFSRDTRDARRRDGGRWPSGGPIQLVGPTYSHDSPYHHLLVLELLLSIITRYYTYILHVRLLRGIPYRLDSWRRWRKEKRRRRRKKRMQTEKSTESRDSSPAAAAACQRTATACDDGRLLAGFGACTPVRLRSAKLKPTRALSKTKEKEPQWTHHSHHSPPPSRCNIGSILGTQVCAASSCFCKFLLSARTVF